jgi:lipid-binding SYLF domain-containing protein
MRRLIAFTAAALAASALVFTPALAKKPVHHKPVVCALSTASGRTQKLVSDATRTFYDFQGLIPPDVLRQAKGIIIVPALVKVGFIIGGQGGDAVLLRRNGAVWSYPAFYSLGSPSLGLQAGISSAQVVLVLMTDRALAAVERDQFRLGSEAGIAILAAGGNSGATSYHGDIIYWARAAGAYLGLTVNDSTLKQEPSQNAEYYDREVPFEDVFAGRVCNSDADPLRRALR